MAVKTLKPARNAKATKSGRPAREPKAARTTGAERAAKGSAREMRRERAAPKTAPGVGRSPRRVWTSGVVAPPPTDTGPTTSELLPLGRARDELNLRYDEFDVALQIGEVPCVACGPGLRKVPAEAVARLRAEDGHPGPLRARLLLVSSDEAAKLLGVGRGRFVRLARAGHLCPVRWYVNRYQAVVWMYLAGEVSEFADRNPALLHGPLPAQLREAVAAGRDRRACGWRVRRAGQLVRDAYDSWEEAAVWAALLGPEVVAGAVPDAYERAHLRRLRAGLPPSRFGRASAERIRGLTTADQPEEVAAGLLALAEALGRARAVRPAPRPGPPLVSGPPAPPPQLPPDASAQPLELHGPPTLPLPRRGPALAVPGVVLGPTVPVPGPTVSGRAAAADLPPAPLLGPFPAIPVPAVPPPAPTPSDSLPPRQAAGYARFGPAPALPRATSSRRVARGTAGPGRRLGLRVLLRGRRSAPDLAEQPFLHDRDQQPPLPVEDLTARQTQGSGRDG
ncbi:DUF6397 family protein [Actinacidiphila sp. ITFR-21]|uniref:DUF6397 family protein n=1 Tax=Actinacidiphila sp. ITFR-21 TaxID=3075199 RepID=UPI00288A1191|nr:DUF6397 family protein [Streptomyces sp. ITFR-21]WNI19087.1 DUF6397 family protein [Streptomyces sp. ITFR-21]